jgi:2-hydroxy-3-oxopropionate reductase
MSNIGFIGLGIMGRPMAGHLIAGGHSLFVHDLAPLPLRCWTRAPSPVPADAKLPGRPMW